MISKDQVSVETQHSPDPLDPRPHYIFRIRLRELDLVSPPLFTLEHVEHFKDMVLENFNVCSHCGKKATGEPLPPEEFNPNKPGYKGKKKTSK